MACGQPAKTEQDKKWERENDARALIEAQEIRDDPKRYKGAMQGLKDKQEETAKTAALEAKVAKDLKKTFPHNPGKSDKGGY